MTEKLNIVQSTTEPDNRNIWLKDNELKKFGAKGWSTIGGSNTGGGSGGTSTDKDTLDVYLDVDAESVIVNDKTFAATINHTDSGFTFQVQDKELYDILYNFLVFTYKTAYIKTLHNKSNTYIFGEASCTAEGDMYIALSLGTVIGLYSVLVTSQ